MNTPPPEQLAAEECYFLVAQNYQLETPTVISDFEKIIAKHFTPKLDEAANAIGVARSQYLDECTNHELTRQERDQLKAQLAVMSEKFAALVENYCSLVSSGDCGSWNPETDQIIIDSRQALSTTPAESLAEFNELRRKAKALDDVFQELEIAPELNHSNYDHDDVCALNNHMIEAFSLAKKAIEQAAAQQKGQL